MWQTPLGRAQFVVVGASAVGLERSAEQVEQSIAISRSTPTENHPKASSKTPKLHHHLADDLRRATQLCAGWRGGVIETIRLAETEEESHCDFHSVDSCRRRWRGRRRRHNSEPNAGRRWTETKSHLRLANPKPAAPSARLRPQTMRKFGLKISLLLWLAWAALAAAGVNANEWPTGEPSSRPHLSTSTTTNHGAVVVVAAASSAASAAFVGPTTATMGATSRSAFGDASSESGDAVTEMTGDIMLPKEATQELLAGARAIDQIVLDTTPTIGRQRDTNSISVAHQLDGPSGDHKTAAATTTTSTRFEIDEAANGRLESTSGAPLAGPTATASTTPAPSTNEQSAMSLNGTLAADISGIVAHQLAQDAAPVQDAENDVDDDDGDEDDDYGDEELDSDSNGSGAGGRRRRREEEEGASSEPIDKKTNAGDDDYNDYGAYVIYDTQQTLLGSSMALSSPSSSDSLPPSSDIHSESEKSQAEPSFQVIFYAAIPPYKTSTTTSATPSFTQSKLVENANSNITSQKKRPTPSGSSQRSFISTTTQRAPSCSKQRRVVSFKSSSTSKEDEKETNECTETGRLGSLNLNLAPEPAQRVAVGNSAAITQQPSPISSQSVSGAGRQVHEDYQAGLSSSSSSGRPSAMASRRSRRHKLHKQHNEPPSDDTESTMTNDDDDVDQVRPDENGHDNNDEMDADDVKWLRKMNERKPMTLSDKVLDVDAAVAPNGIANEDDNGRGDHHRRPQQQIKPNPTLSYARQIPETKAAAADDLQMFNSSLGADSLSGPMAGHKSADLLAVLEWTQSNGTNSSNITTNEHQTHQVHYWRLIWFVLPLGATFGNLLVIMAVYMERSLQSVTNYFIVSLAFSDLFVGLIVMPFAVYVLVNEVWELSDAICDIYVAVDVTSSTASILNLVAISIDRYRAVAHPIAYSARSSSRRAMLTILLVWLISCCVGAPIILGLNTSPDRQSTLCIFYNSTFIFWSSLTSFYVPCIIMIGLYWRILNAIRSRTKKAIQATGNNTRPAQQQHQKVLPAPPVQPAAASLATGPQPAPQDKEAPSGDNRPKQPQQDSQVSPLKITIRTADTANCRLACANLAAPSDQVVICTCPDNSCASSVLRDIVKSKPLATTKTETVIEQDKILQSLLLHAATLANEDTQTANSLLAKLRGANFAKLKPEEEATIRADIQVLPFDLLWCSSNCRNTSNKVSQTGAEFKQNSAEICACCKRNCFAQLDSSSASSSTKCPAPQMPASFCLCLVDKAPKSRVDDDDDDDGEEEEEELDKIIFHLIEVHQSEGLRMASFTSRSHSMTSVTLPPRSLFIIPSLGQVDQLLNQKAPKKLDASQLCTSCASECLVSRLVSLEVQEEEEEEDSRQQPGQDCQVDMKNSSLTRMLKNEKQLRKRTLNEPSGGGASSHQNGYDGFCSDSGASDDCGSDMSKSDEDDEGDSVSSGSSSSSSSTNSSMNGIEWSANQSSKVSSTRHISSSHNNNSCCQASAASCTTCEKLHQASAHRGAAATNNEPSSVACEEWQRKVSTTSGDLRSGFGSSCYLRKSSSAQCDCLTENCPNSSTRKSGNHLCEPSRNTTSCCMHHDCSSRSHSLNTSTLDYYSSSNAACCNAKNNSNHPTTPVDSQTSSGVIESATREIKRRSIRLSQMLRSRNKASTKTSLPVLSSGAQHQHVVCTVSSGPLTTISTTDNSSLEKADTKGADNLSTVATHSKAAADQSELADGSNQIQLVVHQLDDSNANKLPPINKSPLVDDKSSPIDTNEKDSSSNQRRESGAEAKCEAAPKLHLVASIFDYIRHGSDCNKAKFSHQQPQPNNTSKLHHATAKDASPSQPCQVVNRHRAGSRRRREKNAARRERKATKTLAIVLGIFLICWTPFFTCNIIDGICIQLSMDCRPGMMVYLVTTWLGYINSLVNPIIYTIFNMEFRRAFKRILSNYGGCCIT